MNRSTRFPAWLERRGYSIRTKKRIGTGRSPGSAGATATGATRIDNVVPFPARLTLREATTDCPEVSVLVLPPSRVRPAR